MVSVGSFRAYVIRLLVCGSPCGNSPSAPVITLRLTQSVSQSHLIQAYVSEREGGEGEGETERDRERQRETERDRERQRETERDRERQSKSKGEAYIVL